jgi:hypothetical protein
LVFWAKLTYVDVEYYTVLERKKILSQASSWMNLDTIMITEINQSQKTLMLYGYI